MFNFEFWNIKDRFIHDDTELTETEFSPKLTRNSDI